eukprot:8006268-Alexandrium_andersonii.AAC.1
MSELVAGNLVGGAAIGLNSPFGSSDAGVRLWCNAAGSNTMGVAVGPAPTLSNPQNSPDMG